MQCPAAKLDCFVNKVRDLYLFDTDFCERFLVKTGWKIFFFKELLVCFILRNHRKNSWSLWFRSTSTKTVYAKL